MRAPLEVLTRGEVSGLRAPLSMQAEGCWGEGHWGEARGQEWLVPLPRAVPEQGSP